jgi:hypothetical protein
MKVVNATGGTNHNLTVDFQGMPRGVRTKYAGDKGLFKDVKLNRGQADGISFRGFIDKKRPPADQAVGAF